MPSGVVAPVLGLFSVNQPRNRKPAKHMSGCLLISLPFQKNASKTGTDIRPAKKKSLPGTSPDRLFSLFTGIQVPKFIHSLNHSITHSKLANGLLQISDEVFHVFDAHAEADKRIRQAAFQALHLRDAGVRHGGRVSAERFYPTQ